jgi:hypothetical protein
VGDDSRGGDQEALEPVVPLWTPATPNSPKEAHHMSPGSSGVHHETACAQGTLGTK